MFEPVNRVLAWYKSFNDGGQSRRALLSWHNNRDRGASAVEYALLLAFIAGAIAVLVFSLGTAVQGKFQTACNNIAGTTCSNGNP
jgi:Flp pilus assembly pilin Flp